MKPLHAFTLLIISAATAAAQTNTFPASGNVGIGTTNPASKLHVADPAHAQISLEKTGLNTASIFNDGSLHIKSGSGITYYDSNYHIFLDLNNVEQMRIDPNGNVGIGTTGPGGKLELANSANTANSLYLVLNGGYEHGEITPGDVGGMKFQIRGATVNQISSTERTSDSYALDFKTFSGESSYTLTTKMSILGNGNIGIGTTNPESKLQVARGLGGESRITIGDGTTGGWSNLVLRSGPVKRAWLLAAQTNVDQAFEITPSNADGGTTFSSPAFVVQQGGNVGIGTTTPAHKLSVNGTVRAKEVIVDTGWSDYVFAKDYKLASLSEVEQHITQKGHLPGVPSAVEVAEKGVSVGDMQAVLLAKVEELTLYMIELKKENAELRTEVRQLRRDK